MIKRTLDSINDYFFKLENELEELKSFKFYIEDSYYLINRLINFNRSVYNSFKESNQDFLKVDETEEEKENFLKNNLKDLKIYFSYFSAFKRIIVILKNAKNININPAIYVLIDDIIEKIDKTTKFIIFPYFQLGCGYINLRTLLDRFPDRFKEIGILNLPIFSIPFLNKAEIFFNSTLAHEIGHFIEESTGALLTEENNITQNILKNKTIFNEIFKRLNKLMDENPDLDEDLECIRLTGIITKNLFEKIKQWIKEILSDLIGFKIFGLPFLFGFIKSISHSEEYGTPEHPPPWLRFNYLYEEYENSFIKQIEKFNFKDNINKIQINFGDKIQSDLLILKKYFDKIKSEQPPSVHKVKLELINSSVDFNKLISDILKERPNLKQILYEYNDKNKKEISKLLESLLIYVTPNEIIEYDKKETYPADYLNILNAGWLFYLYLINNHFSILNMKEDNFNNRPVIFQRLNNLILKAIELSNIHKYSIFKLKK